MSRPSERYAVALALTFVGTLALSSLTAPAAPTEARWLLCFVVAAIVSALFLADPHRQQEILRWIGVGLGATFTLGAAVYIAILTTGGLDGRAGCSAEGAAPCLRAMSYKDVFAHYADALSLVAFGLGLLGIFALKRT